MKSIAWTLAFLTLFAATAFAIDFQMQTVESSLIAQIGYDTDSESMAIQMHNSSDVYVYLNVPQAVFDEFLHADSKGRYFVDNIKGQYQTQRRE